MAWETWTIVAGDDQATICNFGAMVMDWQVTDTFTVSGASPIPGQTSPDMQTKQTRHVIDGWRNEEEARGLDSYRNAILVPWAGRLQNGKYTFEGKEYDAAGKVRNDPSAIHGLAADQEFVKVDGSENSLVLEATLPKADYYPFDVRVRVTYTITTEPHRLDLRVEAFNEGDTNAPIWIGWHPYFICQKGSADTSRITIPADLGIRFDENMDPAPGLRAFEQHAYPVTLVHRRDCDFGYTNLHTENGVAEAKMYHIDGSETCVQLIDNEIGMGIGAFQVYSGQYANYRRGQSVSIEPLNCMTNAFNREETREFITIKPGEKQDFHAAVEYYPIAKD